MTMSDAGCVFARRPRSQRKLGARRCLFLAASLLLLAPMPSTHRAGGWGFITAASAAVPCVADCDGGDSVSPEELLLAVEIALLRAAPGDCDPADPDLDGVTVDDLVRAVRAHLESCEGASPTPLPTPVVPMVVSGRCRRPGPSGLVACDAGFQVDVLRCDDRPTCLEPTSPKTLLGNGPIGAQGAFSVVIDQQSLGDNTMLVQAEAALQPATIYRILDIGSLGTGGGRGLPGTPEVKVEIDPSSEGAMRALENERGPLGLDAFSNDDIQNLVETTRSAAGDYAGQTPEQAAQFGEQIASGLSEPQLRSFVSEFGSFTYHVLSSGAFAHRFTSLAVTSSPTASDGVCAGLFDLLVAGAVATFVPDANIVNKSVIAAGENVVFNPLTHMGAGRVCVGAGCLPDASCPAALNDCHVFSYDENATPLVQGTFEVPDALKVFVQSAGGCFFDANTFAFGTSEPTIQAELESPVPFDGFTLPPSTTIVFAQRTQAGGSYFAGVAGFRLRSVAGATVLSGAVAKANQGGIPPVF